MLPENANSQPQYTAFIKKVVEQDEVWALEGGEGLAISSSSNNEEQDVIPFWSSEELAGAVAADDWADFKPVPMSLAEFLENWLTVMHNDEMLVGMDWDAALTGRESEPMELALDLAKEAVAMGKAPELSNYKDLEEFIREVKEATGL
jgi:hypothetical protein